MGLWDALTGRSKPVQANLDALFALPSAAITLQTAAGLPAHRRRLGLLPRRRGRGVRPDAERRRRAARQRRRPGRRAQHRRLRLHLAAGPPGPDDLSALVTDLHTVNTSLEAQGFGPSLLCSLVGFKTRPDVRLGLVYLYKQGTFYPFAPAGPAAARQPAGDPGPRPARGRPARRAATLSRWMPLWGAPGLEVVAVVRPVSQRPVSQRLEGQRNCPSGRYAAGGRIPRTAR